MARPRRPAKAAPKRPAARKPAGWPSRAAARKTATRKTAARKTATRKTATRKTATRKTATRMAAATPSKAAGAKPAPTEPAARSGSSARTGLLAIEAQLREHAMAKPEATEHFPWGERAIKVKGKVFLFMRADAQQLSLSTKLPRSSSVALLLPFATPTGYGLGKAGWVSAEFTRAERPPVEMLRAWIDESYQAVAPARLAALARTGD